VTRKDAELAGYLKIQVSAENSAPPVRECTLRRVLSLSLSLSLTQFSPGQSNFVGLTPPLVSFRPYVRPLPREFNVHAKQTAAPARLSIIRYIRPWPSNPSLTTPQTRREEEERTDKDGRRSSPRSSVAQGGPKCCGAPWRSRRAVSDDKEDRGGEMDQERILSGNRLVFQRSRRRSRRPLHPLCVSLFASRRGQIRDRATSVPRRRLLNVSELQMCTDPDETRRCGGGPIETGCEFRDASSNMYSARPGAETRGMSGGEREEELRGQRRESQPKRRQTPGAALIWRCGDGPIILVAFGTSAFLRVKRVSRENRASIARAINA